MNVVANTVTLLNNDAIARRFAQGMRVSRRVELTVLVHLEHVASTYGGETFTLRRAA